MCQVDAGDQDRPLQASHCQRGWSLRCHQPAPRVRELRGLGTQGHHSPRTGRPYLRAATQRADVSAQVRFFVDKSVKNFLVACWRVRESIVGVQTVAAGCLMSVASSRSVDDVIGAQAIFEELDVNSMWVGNEVFLEGVDPSR